LTGRKWNAYRIEKIGNFFNLSNNEASGTKYKQMSWESNYTHLDSKYTQATLVEFIITYNDLIVRVDFLLNNKAKVKVNQT